MKFIKLKFNKGSLSIELLVATAVIAVALVSAILASAGAIKAARQTLRQTQAAYLLEEGAEAVKLIRGEGWSNISALTDSTDYYLSFSGTAWTLSTTPNTNTPFTRVVNFDEVERDANDDIVTSGGTVDTGTRYVNIEVSWNEGNVVKSKILEFYISDSIS